MGIVVPKIILAASAHLHLDIQPFWHPNQFAHTIIFPFYSNVALNQKTDNKAVTGNLNPNLYIYW